MELFSDGISLAIQDFQRARSKANLQEALARLTGRSADLLSYDDVRRKLRAVESASRQLEDIPLDAIIGSVGRYNDFTRSFLPRQDSDQMRWARLKAAVDIDLASLPPIEVYRIGQAYFVLDGNHRVSIARQSGATHIQAYVTEVRTRVPLSPDVQPDDLIIKAEYAEFLEHTHIDELRPGANLEVTVPGQYKMLEEHIQVHRYFMGLEQQREIPYREAVAHWYDVVYLPVVQVIRERGMLEDFPGRTEADLYLWIADHRAALEEELGWEIRPEAAAASLVNQFSPRPQRIVARLGEKLRDAVLPDRIEPGPPPGRWREDRLAGRQTDQLFADILVGVTGDDAAWRALEQAIVVVRREQARLHGLHVLPSEDQRESAIAQALLAEFNRRCAEAGVQGDLVFEVGEVARATCDIAHWTDLVILSLSHPPGDQPLARLSSGLSTLIRRCPRLVMTVPGDPSPLDRMLLAYDGSPKSDEALFAATYLSIKWNAPLVVLTVLDPGRVTADALSRARAYIESRGGGAMATYVERPGQVGQVILSVLEEERCNLVIMGGYGLTPVLEVVLGSAVDEVLRTSRWPTLVCR